MELELIFVHKNAGIETGKPIWWLYDELCF